MPYIIPWKRSEMIRIRRQIDELCDHFFDELDRRLARSGIFLGWSMREDNDRFVLVLDLPGVDPKDIELTLSKDILTIKAWHRQAETLGQGEYRSRLYLERSIRLTTQIDCENVEAIYKGGQLTVILPKRRTKVYKIPVN